MSAGLPIAAQGVSANFFCPRGQLEIIAAHAGVVTAVLCGHDHRGGYHYDEASNVHHITVASPLNEGAAGSAFGVVIVHDDRLEVHSPALESVIKAADLDKMRAAGGRCSDANLNAIALPLVKLVRPQPVC